MVRPLKDHIRAAVRMKKHKAGNSPKFDRVMHEWGQGELHSGSKHGPVVGKGKQKVALAIAFSEARKAKGGK